MDNRTQITHSTLGGQIPKYCREFVLAFCDIYLNHENLKFPSTKYTVHCRNDLLLTCGSVMVLIKVAVGHWELSAPKSICFLAELCSEDEDKPSLLGYLPTGRSSGHSVKP